MFKYYHFDKYNKKSKLTDTENTLVVTSGEGPVWHRRGMGGKYKLLHMTGYIDVLYNTETQPIFFNNSCKWTVTFKSCIKKRLETLKHC